MPKAHHLLISMTLTLSLYSCATIGREFDLRNVSDLEVGKTTMAEARQLFGYPVTEIDVATWGYKRAHFGDEDAVTIWRYLYAKGTVGSAKARTLQIEFDKNGRVSDYYPSSSFEEDNLPDPKGKDFDIFKAQEDIVPGKTTKKQVLSLLGSGYRKIAINKPGTAERWHYGFTEKSEVEKQVAGQLTSGAPIVITKIYGKGLDVDFDKRGAVVHLRGESDFPRDKDRFFTK